MAKNNCTTYKIYLCEYRFEGETWSVEIPATSFEEAKLRMGALQHGNVAGVLMGSIPTVGDKNGFFSKIIGFVVSKFIGLMNFSR